MFLLVPARPGFPGQIEQSRKTVVCVVCVCYSHTLITLSKFPLLISLLFSLDFCRPKLTSVASRQLVSHALQSP